MATKAVAERKQATDPIRQAVDQMAPEFKAALPAHVSVDKFVRVSMTAINSNPDLREADRRSLFGSVTRLAQDGLMPDGREAALVIFNSKQNGQWVKKVQAMPMIAGLMKMMRQSGEVAWVDAQVVHANDFFQYRPGLDDIPTFEPDWFGDRGEPVGAYAVARLKSGEIVPPEIMSATEIEKVRSVSRAKDRGPWVDWWEQMALKTVMRRYLKRLPTSTDMLATFDRDETMATTIEPVRLSAPAPEQEPDQPAGRLDALEHHIEEGEAEEVEDDGTDELTSDDPTFADEIKSAETPEALDAIAKRIDAAAIDMGKDEAEALDALIAGRRRELGGAA